MTKRQNKRAAATLGFGPVGAAVDPAFDALALAQTFEILERVVTRFTKQKNVTVSEAFASLHVVGCSKKNSPSDVAREKTLRFWDESMPSRLNDQDHGVFIVIMQRVHERDLSGHILTSEMGWTHLCLPAVYEPKHPHPIRTSVIRKSTQQIWTDPRNEGEALWPEKFSLEGLQRMAKDEALSTHMAAGQLQQRPSAREGGLFKREWFANPVKFAPEKQQLARAWDFASSVQLTNDPDWTVGLLMGRHDPTDLIYIIDVIRARLSPGHSLARR
jgi:hypothetical protein